ncbi:hypothetical protein MIND_01095600 [Mycena indigotica]|uniref:Uncharacterized protein n=1 Tax=Mycena indigotica TaxID=2126181 RepID=A0A8H6SB89_9AGAR|nr:uncharacterized protein MIND_01095600 [Mycena indigotica]KAF7295556.1 hypothetical protein MIND_01095600 [Mycena indigotica]
MRTTEKKKDNFSRLEKIAYCGVCYAGFVHIHNRNKHMGSIACHKNLRKKKRKALTPALNANVDRQRLLEIYGDDPLLDIRPYSDIVYDIEPHGPHLPELPKQAFQKVEYTFDEEFRIMQNIYKIEECYNRFYPWREFNHNYLPAAVAIFNMEQAQFNKTSAE